MTDVLTPRSGGPERDDPIDWSESPIARAYRRGDGVISYRSPNQLARPGARGPAHTLAVHRNRSFAPQHAPNFQKGSVRENDYNARIDVLGCTCGAEP